MKTFLTFCLLAIFAPCAHAGLNKWVDENGAVHYSDSKPAGVKADPVRNVTGKDPAATGDGKPESYVERERELKKARQEKQAAADKQAKEKALQEERQRNCLSAKESLRALESSGRIVTYDANGEKVYLDDAARERRMQDARATVKANCD